MSKRRDARFCSPLCRHAVYRQRAGRFGTVKAPKPRRWILPTDELQTLAARMVGA